MRRFLFISILLLAFGAPLSFGQNDSIYIRLSVDVYKLQREIAAYEDSLKNTALDYHRSEEQIRDKIRLLESYSVFKKSRKANSERLTAMDNTIDSLSCAVSSLEESQAQRRSDFGKKIKESRSKGEQDIFLPLVREYTSHSFDELASMTTLQSLSQDRALLSSYADIVALIDDLTAFHEGEQVLRDKYSSEAVEKVRTRLSMIGRHSEALECLNRKLDRYSDFNARLVNTVRTCDLDGQGRQFLVEGTKNERIFRDKYLKIMKNLSDGVLSEGFSFVDYPYLSEIILELIIVKKYHPDKDITYLLDRLI